MKDRRDFLKTSAVFMGVLGTAGLAGNLSRATEAAAADVKIKPTAATANLRSAKILKLDRQNLGKLGNNLFSNDNEQRKFLSNPEGYAESFLGGRLDASSKAKLQMLQEMVAGGFCCSGCGCGVPAMDVKILTQ